MFQLILINNGAAPLQVTNRLMKKRQISLSEAINLVNLDHPVVYETANEQDANDFKQELESFGATVGIVQTT